MNLCSTELREAYWKEGMESPCSFCHYCLHDLKQTISFLFQYSSSDVESRLFNASIFSFRDIKGFINENLNLLKSYLSVRIENFYNFLLT